jgi:hypothetical protein
MNATHKTSDTGEIVGALVIEDTYNLARKIQTMNINDSQIEERYIQ